jgi:hypothetical protein
MNSIVRIIRTNEAMKGLGSSRVPCPEMQKLIMEIKKVKPAVIYNMVI